MTRLILETFVISVIVFTLLWTLMGAVTAGYFNWGVGFGAGLATSCFIFALALIRLGL